MSVLDTLNGATSPRRTVTLCLDGALQAEHDELTKQLDAAAIKDAESLAAGNLARVVGEMDAIRDRMAAAEVTFAFEGLDWPARLALQALHPPRPGVVVDQLRGWNIATFTPAIIKASCISVTGADGDTATEIPEETWTNLLGDPEADPPVRGSLNLGQIDRLSGAAMFVNDRETSVPTSARSLLESQDSGASLAQPSPGTSPRSGSEAGSPPTSPKSSATKKAPTKARSASS